MTAVHKVLTEFPVPDSREKIDVAVVKGNKPRLLIEIKETGRPRLPKDRIEAKVQPDVAKLLKCSMTNGNRVVFFFFRGANRKDGIGVRTNDCMEQLK